MRTLIIILTVIALLVGMELVVTSQINIHSQELCEELAALKENIEKEDYAGAAGDLKRTNDVWESFKPIWDTIVPHEHTEEIACGLLRMEAYLTRRDTDDILSEIAAIEACLTHITESMSFSLANFL